jgi:CheY-like chemotaxis protein/two-component sensor histidine kinase
MLSVIRGWVDELEVETAGHVREGLAEIRGAAERATRLVRQMAMLSRKAPAQHQSVPPNHALEELAGLLRRSVGERVTLRLDLAPEPWAVVADPSQLGQIFLNLAVNARDAMRPDGGTLTFRTENVAAGTERAQGLPPGDCVILSVSDEGSGIPEEVRERIFEPFFTTKPAGQGTGLGLAIVHGIVRQAGGTIQVRSAPAQGTTFVIALPRAPEAAVQAASATAPGPDAEPARVEGTALVVHLDPQVRSVLGRALRRACFQVLEVQDPGQALTVARAHRGTLDVLVSSAVIPGSSGPALAGVLRRERPGLRAVVLSGLQADPAVTAFASEGGEVLQEPFRPAEVVEAVRKVLAHG